MIFVYALMSCCGENKKEKKKTEKQKRKSVATAVGQGFCKSWNTTTKYNTTKQHEKCVKNKNKRKFNQKQIMCGINTLKNKTKQNTSKRKTLHKEKSLYDSLSLSPYFTLFRFVVSLLKLFTLCYDFSTPVHLFRVLH